MEDDKKIEIYLNYKRKNKWLGIIDYKSLIFIVIYVILLISILKFINVNMEYMIYILIFGIIPIVAVICVNIGNENAIDMLIVILKFNLSKKIYIKKEYYIDLKKEKYVKKV